MAELYIFTIVAAFVGVYSILPDHKKLRIRFAFSTCFWLVATISSIIVLLIYLTGVYIESANPDFRYFCGNICIPATFWIEAGQIFIAASVSGYGIWKLVKNQSDIKDDGETAAVLRQLFSKRDFDTLVSVISGNYRNLIKNVNSQQYPESKSVTEGVLTDERIVPYYSQLDPSLAFKIIEDTKAPFDRREFTTKYLNGLFDDKSSLLYHEIENNRNGEYGPYQLPTANRLLNSLFSNCEIAKDLAIWNPIRREVRTQLDDLNKSSDDPYVNRDGAFQLGNPGVIFRDRIYVGVRVYNIMAAAALEQGLNHHLFFHYIGTFSEDICRNYELGPQSNPSAEFPNDYSYLLNEIMNMLEHIIELVIDPNTEVRTAISKPNTEYENDIIKAAIWALVMSHKSILMCQQIPTSFKSYVTSGFLETYLSLAVNQDEIARMYATAFRQYLISQSVDNPISDQNHQQYLTELHR
ncbi:hypothetical protein [Halococcus sp. PRR34]|uniref:hypothetical protein n=1 Tax=Halococcus sp. PRR34 TaxID=3020830 RepID=UPI00236116A4|nr:hypothetical protein [Halococcus sp. PRR34]